MLVRMLDVLNDFFVFSLCLSCKLWDGVLKYVMDDSFHILFKLLFKAALPLDVIDRVKFKNIEKIPPPKKIDKSLLKVLMEHIY